MSFSVQSSFALWLWIEPAVPEPQTKKSYRWAVFFSQWLLPSKAIGLVLKLLPGLPGCPFTIFTHEVLCLPMSWCPHAQLTSCGLSLWKRRFSTWVPRNAIYPKWEIGPPIYTLWHQLSLMSVNISGGSAVSLSPSSPYHCTASSRCWEISLTSCPNESHLHTSSPKNHRNSGIGMTPLLFSHLGCRFFNSLVICWEIWEVRQLWILSSPWVQSLTFRREAMWSGSVIFKLGCIWKLAGITDHCVQWGHQYRTSRD